MDLELGYLSAFSDQSIWEVDEFIQVLRVFGLTCHCSQGFVSDYRFFLFIFYAFSNQIFIVLASNLTQNETNFMLQQTRLCFEVLFRKEETENFDAFLCFSVSHQVHDPVFTEEGNIFSQKESQKSILLEDLLKFMLFQKGSKLLLIKRSSRLFCLKVGLSISILQCPLLYFFNGYFAGPSQLFALGMHMVAIQFLQLRKKIIGQGLCSLMSRQIVVFLIIDNRNEKFLQDEKFIFFQLPQSVQNFVREQY